MQNGRQINKIKQLIKIKYKAFKTENQIRKSTKLIYR